MKRTFLVISLLTNSLYLSAQLESGSFEIGGNGNYYQSDLLVAYGGSSITGINKEATVNIQVGYFITNTISIGIRSMVSYQNFEIENYLYNSTTNNYETFYQEEKRYINGAYGRYHYGLNNYAGVFLELEAGMGQGNLNYNEEDTVGGINNIERPRDLIDFGVGAGLYINPSEYGAITLSVHRYNRLESYIPQGTTLTVQQQELYTGYSIRFGVRIYLHPSLFSYSSKKLPGL